MTHSYWIIKDPTPLKTLPTVRCALQINCRWSFLINNFKNYCRAITITDAVVCVCVCVYIYIHVHMYMYVCVYGYVYVSE